MSDVDIFHAPRDFEFHNFDTRNVTASDGGTATLRFPVSTPMPCMRWRRRCGGIAPRNWRGIPRTGSST
ncbi:hypothetical protein [Bifidobacterium adolescentis]|uniref:hypothetical protein n=1 Tax=Bifidobacterium adolescentis TaxID=1680 RepID=UPI003CE4539B